MVKAHFKSHVTIIAGISLLYFRLTLHHLMAALIFLLGSIIQFIRNHPNRVLSVFVLSPSFLSYDWLSLKSAVQGKMVTHSSELTQGELASFAGS
jgi:hypothetical protein